MFEKFSYVKLPDNCNDMAERVERLFVINGQQKRYEHILSVVKQIDDIGSRYGLDKTKCYIAAMLHDVSTLIKPEDMLSYAKQNGWNLCDAEESHPFLLHQRVSEVVAREDFNVTDEEVLEAITYHTSLCENPTKYQMALFVADKLAWSPGGLPPYYKQMSEALNASLEAACYEYIKYMESEGKMFSVHADWAKAVNWIKK